MKEKTVLPPGYYNLNDADYVYENTFDTIFRYFSTNFMKGKILEFGTYKGYSAKKIACKMKEYDKINDFYMFDSFEGLPEITSDIDINSYQVKVAKDWQKGTFNSATGYETSIKKEVGELISPTYTHVIKGYFEKTLNKIKYDKASVILVNIDCDLYSSIVLVLNKLINEKVFQDGSIILFDDYNFNRANNNMGVRKAIKDTFDKQEKYELELFFNYGWHGRAFIIHDNDATVE